MLTLMFHTSIIAIMIAATVLPLSAFPTLGRPSQAAWLSTHSGYQPGKPVVTALRITLGRGWHTYWINPGEAGMPLTAKFELPDGWEAEAPQYPIPKRFQTGDLHDFGYSGTVWFPIILHPPADAEGDVELAGAFSWLTCNDASCVPGDADLKLRLTEGASEATNFIVQIEDALKLVPTKAPTGWGLRIKDTGDSLELELTHPDSIQLDKLDVFPMTINTVHPAAPFDWQPSGNKATTTVKKSPFAPKSVESLELAINHPSLEQPITVGRAEN